MKFYREHSVISFMFQFVQFGPLLLTLRQYKLGTTFHKSQQSVSFVVEFVHFNNSNNNHDFWPVF